MTKEYFCVLYVTYNDETANKKAIYGATDAAGAVSMVYKYMGQYMASDNVDAVTCAAMTNTGNLYKHEAWVRPNEETDEYGNVTLYGTRYE